MTGVDEVPPVTSSSASTVGPDRAATSRGGREPPADPPPRAAARTAGQLLSFGVLGPLTVWTDDGRPVTVPGLKVRALLADLLLHEGHAVPVDRLIDDLWGADLPSRPTASLQVKVSQLRRVLDDAAAGARALVESGPAGYRLRAAPGSVDAQRFDALVVRAQGLADPRSRAGALTEALSLWRGPALGGLAEFPFAQRALVRLDEQRLAALEELAEARLALGEHALLVAELTDLVAQHPLRERLRAAQLRALYGSGRPREALEAYDRHRRHLRDELGLEPGPDLVGLHRSILSHDPVLAASAGAHGRSSRPVGNLPFPLTAEPDGGLIGRRTAIEEAGRRLETDRLVTLTGPGGVGKTQLAIEVARNVAAARADGAWLVELGSRQAHTGELADATTALASAVAAAMGIREDVVSPGAPVADDREHVVADRVVDALASRHLLLVLDDCEHVIEPVAHLVERLLRAAPTVQVLVTSQEPVGLPGEVVLPVAPLDLPARDASFDELAGAAAVRLFVTRAAAAHPGFTLTEEDGPTVADICRRLDGIPLALELAATRVRGLHVRELAQRLDRRFELLTSGPRTAPRRQQTLRAVIDWSWHLSSHEEQVVLRRLAVHPGGWTLEAAEHVCAADDLDAGQVVRALPRLVDRSLVVVADDETGRRYRLLESVATYAAERLVDEDDADAVRARHAIYYTVLAERTASSLRGPGQREALRQLDREADNLRGAIETSVGRGDAAMALRLVNALAWYWFLRGRYGEARRSLSAVLDLPATGRATEVARAEAAAWLAGVAATDHRDDPVVRRRDVLGRYADLDDPAGRARARWLLAHTMLGSADGADAAPLVREALDGFRARGDGWGVAAALATRAELALGKGDLAAVRRDSEASLRLFDELGDRWGRLQPTRLLGSLAEIAGDYARADQLHRDALRLAEELELWPAVATQLASLGRVALLVGNESDAEELLERARRLAQDQSDEAGDAYAMTGLAIAARRQGQLIRAEGLLRDLLRWHRRTGFLPGTALVLAELGFVADAHGRPEDARTLHLESLATARASGDDRAVALAIEGLAGASAALEEHERAAKLLGAAAAAREEAGAPLPPAERGDVDRIEQAARRGLGSAAFTTAFAEGRRSGAAGLV